MAGGRPTAYKEEYADQARKLCLLGYTDKELADFWNVTEQTINNWKKDFPEFFESIKEGKESADADIAETLYNKAMGKCTITEEKDDGDKVVITKKQIPPSDTSIIFWLTNRQRDKWKREKNDSESSQDSIAESLEKIANNLPV